MGLAMYAEGHAYNRLGSTFDGVEAPFLRLCRSAPRESLRWGVMQYGDTYFNRAQLERLVEELEALPPDRPVIVEEVLRLARLAIRNAGYLHVIGD
ncbi:hypothetical protein ACFZAO_10090 [Streptomyces griseoaurantiacus]|uniref:hypothetical protein n=1 Tax=Streptomyces griseoaurantiacus TaxID=68213 RepID=UPI0036E68AA0